MTRQRGVALITAMLIVALATILATQIGFKSALEQRRSAGILLLDQAFQVGMGAEAWAASYLKDDLENGSTTDHLAERWATPIPPIPIDGGTIEGKIDDLQGRFNLNNLRFTDGKQNPVALIQFRQLLTLLELEPKWANAIADWIDADNEESPEGGEDGLYLSQTPSYRTPNTPISSTSELLSLQGFGLDRYRRLQPYVTALPIGTLINVCTAPGPVLDALDDGVVQWSLDPESLAKNREQRCFPDKAAFLASISDNDRKTAVQNLIAEKSDYFRLRAFVTIGTTEFSLYSLLHREAGLVRPVMRSFGPE